MTPFEGRLIADRRLDCTAIGSLPRLNTLARTLKKIFRVCKLAVALKNCATMPPISDRVPPRKGPFVGSLSGDE